jgi:Beta-lactamase
MDSDGAGLTDALQSIRGITVDPAAIRAHVMYPPNVVGVRSDQGLGQPPRGHSVSPSSLAQYVFDIDGFVTDLQSTLEGQVAGYQMELRQDGDPVRSLSYQWAQEPFAHLKLQGGELWNTAVRMHVASCSKIITAIAMMQCLTDLEISPETPIIGYLPAYWPKGPGLPEVTFAQLLTHTSGIGYGVMSSRSDYPYMKAQVAEGAAHNGEYWYENMDYGLCRILVATVRGSIPVDFELTGALAGFTDQIWDSITITDYVNWVSANVFAPAGVSGPTLDHPSGDALAYAIPPEYPGWDSGDLTTMVGGAGWHMTAGELASVMGTFLTGRLPILGAQEAQAMLDNGFGVDRIACTKLGMLYAKPGGFVDSTNQVEQSVAFFLPQGFEVVVLVNSPVAPVTPGEEFPGLPLLDLVQNFYLSNIVPNL